MTELGILLMVVIALALWVDHRRAQEIAVGYSRRACDAAGVQFLDETAAMRRVGLARDAAGVMRLRRTYTFEYSPAPGERQPGSVVMLGREVTALRLAGPSESLH